MERALARRAARVRPDLQRRRRPRAPGASCTRSIAVSSPWGHPNVPLEGRLLAAVKACGPRPSSPTSPPPPSTAGQVGRPPVRRHRAVEALASADQGAPQRVDRARRRQAHPGDAEAAHRHRPRATSPTTRRSSALCARRSSAPTSSNSSRDRSSTSAPSPPAARLEDDAYDLVVKGGLQPPEEVNAPYRLPSGTVYPDLRWPALRLIVEVDSPEWHDDPLAQLADAQRQAELEALGERVLRVRSAQLKRRRTASSPACGPRACRMRSYFFLARAV